MFLTLLLLSRWTQTISNDHQELLGYLVFPFIVCSVTSSHPVALALNISFHVLHLHVGLQDHLNFRPEIQTILLCVKAASELNAACVCADDSWSPDRWTAKLATPRPIDCVCLAIDWPRSEGAHHSLSCSNVSCGPIHLHLSAAPLGLISSTAPLVYIVVNPFITLHVS